MATETNITHKNESKQAYQEKVKAELDKINAHINELKAKADQAKADASINYNSMMEELYAKRDAAQSKLDEIGKAGEDAWHDLQGGFEKAWTDLTESFNKAMKNFE